MVKLWTLALVALWSGLAAAGPYDGWQPHAYCNALEGIEDSQIPALSAEQEARVASLQQVQLIVRHGARAPYARLFCWDHAKHSPMDAEWKCTTTSVSSQDIGLNSTTGYGRLYRKSYLKGDNILNGDCIVGGLLPLGRQQHLINGLHLRDSYIGDGALKLFSSDKLSELPPNSLYLRSDDQERTVGSGHALVDGLFPLEDVELSPEQEEMLQWHVADIATDHINANSNICPLMGYIGNLSNESPEFISHENDSATVKLTDDFNDIVGNFSWDSVLECLSTARCNDLELPSGIDEDTFTKVFHEVEVRSGMYYTYNDSWFAKVAMQPLMKEIITRLDASLEGHSDAPKLAITMGHDSTIMPFLAALARQNWDQKWTPYAGVLSMELYETKNNSHAVRVIFHGKPVLIPECADTLCDIESFQQAIAFGRVHRNCTAPVDETDDEEDESAATLVSTTASSVSSFSVSQYAASMLLVGLLALTALLGVVRSRGSRQQPQYRTRDEYVTLLP